MKCLLTEPKYLYSFSFTLFLIHTSKWSVCSKLTKHLCTQRSASQNRNLIKANVENSNSLYLRQDTKAQKHTHTQTHTHRNTHGHTLRWTGHTHLNHNLVKPQFASREATSMMTTEPKATSWSSFLLSVRLFISVPPPPFSVSPIHTPDTPPSSEAADWLSVPQVRQALVWGCGKVGFRLSVGFRFWGLVWFQPLWPPTSPLCSPHTTQGEYPKAHTQTHKDTQTHTYTHFSIRHSLYLYVTNFLK